MVYAVVLTGLLHICYIYGGRDMASKVRINKSTITKLDALDGTQAVYWDEDLPGFGVRVNPGRVVDGHREPTYTFFCQGRVRGKVVKMTIGKFPTVSPDPARRMAREYLSMMHTGQDPRIVHDVDKDVATFGEMLMGYVEWMEQKGKVSTRQVRSEIEGGIHEPFKRLWAKPANEITADDCDRIIERLEEAGKLRQADKIRSYMKTAFRKAINARRKRRYPDGLKMAGVKSNPCNDIEKVEGSSKPRDRALTLSEFRAYWRRVQEQPEPRRSVLMLHVLTGAQRIGQLSRVTLHDIDRDSATMTVWDGKGRRSSPYRHVVPLLPEALEAIDRLTGSGDHVFSCDGGRKPISVTYMRDAVGKVRDVMRESGEIEKGHFTPGSIRATVETRLVASPYRVGWDVLAKLLSHGLGGVQAKHYQMHDYADEKREALEKLHRMVEGAPEPSADVIEMRARA